MKPYWLLLLLPVGAQAQIDWKNYSTSFQGSGKEGSRPTLVTAIPYNGRYDNASYGSIKAAEVPLIDSLKITPASQPLYVGKSVTYDSGEVYFLAPGVHPENASRYEYRVIDNGRSVRIPWSPITHFTDKGVALNDFKEDFGFLGGYKTDWGQSVLVELREKSTGQILSASLVNWTDTRPSLRAFYTAADLPTLIRSKGEFWNWKPDTAMDRRVTELNKGDLQFKPEENTVI